MKENLLIDKSIVFASRIIKLHRYLIKTKKETIISKQIVRSGTSIGANVNEANYGQSKADSGCFYQYSKGEQVTKKLV